MNIWYLLGYFTPTPMIDPKPYTKVLDRYGKDRSHSHAYETGWGMGC